MNHSHALVQNDLLMAVKAVGHLVEQRQHHGRFYAYGQYVYVSKIVGHLAMMRTSMTGKLHSDSFRLCY